MYPSAVHPMSIKPSSRLIIFAFAVLSFGIRSGVFAFHIKTTRQKNSNDISRFQYHCTTTSTLMMSSTTTRTNTSNRGRYNKAKFTGGKNNNSNRNTNNVDTNVEFNDRKDTRKGGYKNKRSQSSSNYDENEGGRSQQRWKNLKPKFKKRFNDNSRQEEEEEPVKKKKEQPISSQEKKRRMLMYFKEKQREKKIASKIERPLGFDERVPLTAYFPGMIMTGTVISLTNYGAYVDVGTECDGLLHISQMSREFFVEHPRQVLAAGDEVTVKVRDASPELKKLQLTMLDVDRDGTMAEVDDDDGEERILLTDLEIDDELWGELKRVTDFGAYVEVGAQVDGFLHFMDHPLWDDNKHPSEFMKVGERVRTWVADLDMDKRRIRLTANRPQNLPGPRFAV